MGINKQKDVFLSSEGDQWYSRNKEGTDKYSSENDLLLKEILDLKGDIIDYPKLLDWILNQNY